MNFAEYEVKMRELTQRKEQIMIGQRDLRIELDNVLTEIKTTQDNFIAGLTNEQKQPITEEPTVTE